MGACDCGAGVTIATPRAGRIGRERCDVSGWKNTTEGIGWSWPIVGLRKRRLLGIPWGCEVVRQFRLGPIRQLTYTDERVVEWQPCRKFISDGASIPWLVTCLPDYQRDRWLWPWAHDSAYKDVPAYGHGLWTRALPCLEWRWQPMTRSEVDALCIWEMARDEGMRLTQRRAVWRMVRAFGPRW